MYCSIVSRGSYESSHFWSYRVFAEYMSAIRSFICLRVKFLVDTVDIIGLYLSGFLNGVIFEIEADGDVFSVDRLRPWF